jgi:putative zinc finger protein
VSHLGDRISALVDGELGHNARDRALAHVANCVSCRAALDAERAVKDRLATAPTPGPSPELMARLLAMGEPGDPMPPRGRPMPLAPVVPTLPPPGRGPRFGTPGTRADRSRPSGRPRLRRGRHVAVGVASVAGLMLATAFAAGGQAPPPGAPIAPPSAELSVEHAATTSGLPLSDPAFDAVTASFGGLTFPGAPAR